MKLNEIKYGFRLVEEKKINDLNSIMYRYEHIKSGGMVVHVANDDTNCCFAIGFRTLPQDSTGVCHIIEHSLLCGSKKYPLKEPFVNLLKSSLATFLNAFTAYDWTMYPFASQTPRDFDNILSIYLDAVFNPLSMVDEKPFLQEGWHLELLNEDDIPSYKGVVYNEMKGAMSSVDEVLVQATLAAMYKDTFYKNNSGGDPDVIPSLTYEAYKEFYKKHYTPQNAMTYFYGKLDIEDKLKFLDENYFANFDKSEEEIVIIPQSAHIDTNYEVDYEIGEDEEIKDNTYMSLCYGLDHYNNFEEFLAMNILCDALLSKNNSPLKKAILDAKLGQNVECRIDDDNIIPALHIYLQKTNKNKKEEFKNIFENSVREIVKNGIDKDLLLASINRFEFRDKELDMGRMPKGLVFAMNMMGSFNYRGDLASHLEFSEHYKTLREGLNNGYFEKLLVKYILNSNHYVQVVANPSKELAKVKKAKMDALMKSIKEKMSKDEVKALINKNKELLKYQNHVDTKKELDTLPKLKLRDVPKNVNFLDSKKSKIGGMNAITHEINTNDIAYLRMYFDMNKVSFEELPYVALLKRLFLNVSTHKHSALELNNIVKTYLGELSFTQLCTSITSDTYNFKFKISASALKENINYIPELINEVLLHSKFTKKEVYQILKQLFNDLKQDIIGNGMRLATQMAKSHYSKESALAVQGLSGPKLYEQLNNLANNFNFVELNNKLKDICKRLFNKKNVLVSLSGDKDTISNLKSAVSNIKLPRKEYENILIVNLESPSKEALVIPSGVSYNSLANSLDKMDLKYHGSYNVLMQIVNYDYLWSEVRVKGGAYGCGLSIARNGDVAFGSFRDPNVVNTYEVFKNLPNYLNNYKASKEEFVSYIIGTMSGFDVPASTPLTIDVADLNFLNGATKKTKIEIKKQIMSTKIEDIKAMSKIFETLKDGSSEYTIGNSDKINEYKFDKIKNI